MGKYYIKEIKNSDPWNVYYDEGRAVEDLLWAGNNSDFGDINSSLVKDMDFKAYNLTLDKEVLDDDFEDSVDADEEDYAKELIEIVNNYFEKANKHPLSSKEISDIIDISETLNSTYRRSEEYLELICKLLEIIYGKPFIIGVFRGCSQGDWLDYICPEDLKSSLPFIEACIMGTGTEFAMCEIPLDSPDEFDEQPENIFSDYTELWRENDIKKWAADILGCKPDEVEIIKD